MLILFDIDGTLLLTRKAGVHAMGDAGRELFGDHFTFDGVEFSGRLDPLIWRDLAARNGVADAEFHHDAFRAAYRRHLARRLLEQQTAYALPGVAALIDALRGREGVTLGLLTGNYPETGRMKIEAAGLLADAFAIHAWGIDGATRRDLPPVAIQRYGAVNGGLIEPERVVIIGDTPHDVDCARHNGCRVLGVATGTYSMSELTDCGAHRVMENLEQTNDVLDWLLQSTEVVSD